MLKVIRGAVCAENTAESIGENAVKLIAEIISRNSLEVGEITAIFFTATNDLDQANPATAVRTQLNLHNVAFMCAQEMTVRGMLPRCLRVAVFVETEQSAPFVPVYLGAAATLRQDLT